MKTGRQRGVELITVWALRLAMLAVLVGAWMYGVGPGGVSSLLLPDIPAVLQAFAEIVVDPLTWSQAWVTLREFVAALALSIAAGFVVGFLGSRSRLRAEITEPVLMWGYLTPLVLVYPVIIFWFGVGMESKIIFAAGAGFFPIAFNTLRGFRSVSPNYLSVGRAFGAKKWQTDLWIKFPAAMPMILSGVRIGAALCMIGVILGEMLSSQRGLGFELAKATHTFTTDRAFAFILFLILFVSAFHFILQRVSTQSYKKQ